MQSTQYRIDRGRKQESVVDIANNSQFQPSPGFSQTTISMFQPIFDNPALIALPAIHGVKKIKKNKTHAEFSIWPSFVAGPVLVLLHPYSFCRRFLCIRFNS